MSEKLNTLECVKKGEAAMTEATTAEEEKMFRLKRTLGAIIEMCEGHYILDNSVKALCRINQIDPDEVHQVYCEWQAGRYGAE